MQLYEFYRAVSRLAKRRGWRYGQAAFNHLHDVRPDLAEIVRGTDKDPYHEDFHTNWARWASFTEFLEAHWYKDDK